MEALIILFAFFLFLFVMVLNLRRNSKALQNLPPGPKKLPFIGNLHNLPKDLPHRGLRKLANKYGPLMHLQLGEVRAIVVSSPEVAKEVLRTHDLAFASRPDGFVGQILFYDNSDIGFSPYGEYWRQLRKLCTLELFSLKRVQSFRVAREKEVTELARYMARNSGTPIDLVVHVDKMTNGIITRTTLGKKTEDTAAFVQMMKETQELGTGFSLADLYPSITWLGVITGLKPRMLDLHKRTDRILQKIVDERRAGNVSEVRKRADHEDFIDVLLKLQDPELDFNLTTNNIKAILMDVFIAGGDTSSTTVGWAMSEMLRNPSVLKKAQDEARTVFKDKGYVDESDFHQLNYLKLVIKETLRMHAPIPLLLPRESREQTEINGYIVPAKTLVIVNAWAISRDPRYWDDAETFKPERFLNDSTDYYKGNDFKYFAFGGGRRICPGMTLGLANVELSLAMLLYHFDWNLPNGMRPEDLDMAESYGVAVRRKNRLNVIPTLRIPLPAVE